MVPSAQAYHQILARKPSPQSFSLFAIFANAARSCAPVVDLQFRRAPQYPFAGIVVLLGISCLSRAGR